MKQAPAIDVERAFIHSPNSQSAQPERVEKSASEVGVLGRAVESVEPKNLDRASVLYAIKDYIVQVNFRGYNPDRRKVLSVRRTDRTAWLRNAVIPVRWEVYYYIEGELFPNEGATRLAAGQSPQDLAEKLVDQIWDDLVLWSGFDFTPSSFGLNRGKYADE